MAKPEVTISYQCVCCKKYNYNCEASHSCSCGVIKLRYCKHHDIHYQYRIGSHHTCPKCELVEFKKTKAPVVGLKKCLDCEAGIQPKAFVVMNNGAMVCKSCRIKTDGFFSLVTCSRCEEPFSQKEILYVKEEWVCPSCRKGMHS